jgi:hypothetical protein
MNNEATLEQWKELYEVTIKIKALKPWEYFWDMDVVTIILPNLDEPVYCSIMGRGGEFYGIGTYIGFEAIDGFYRISRSDKLPVEQMPRYQNLLMCNFGSRDELRKDQLEVIKKLSYKFRGKDNWIYFNSHEPGYTPYILDSEEVILLTEVFKNLFMAIRAYIENDLKVDFDNGETLLRRYDEKDKMWYTHNAPMLVKPIQYPVPVLQDELLISKLSKEKLNNEKIEIDILYLNTPINNKSLKRPILPKMIVLADCSSGSILDYSMLEQGDDDAQEIIGCLINYITQLGRPKTTYVRDEYIQSLLFDLCKKTKVELKVKENLDFIDEFIGTFSRFRL